MRLYKLTDQNRRTYGNTEWGEGVTHTAKGTGPLCSSGWIHAYEHPLLAALLNPIHANFSNPILWEAEGEIGIRYGQLKCGCASLTTIREIPLPSITTENRVRFAILCALRVYTDPEYRRWAEGWLDGRDRTRTAAEAALPAAWAATKSIDLIELAEEACR